MNVIAACLTRFIWQSNTVLTSLQDLYFFFFLNGWNFITVFKWNDWTLVHAHAQAQNLSNLSKRCTDVQAFIDIHSRNHHRSRTFLGGFQRYIVWRTREERARCTRNISYMPALRAASETIKRQEQRGSSVCSRMAILNSSLLTAGSLPSVQKQVNKCHIYPQKRSSSKSTIDFLNSSSDFIWCVWGVGGRRRGRGGAEWGFAL